MTTREVDKASALDQRRHGGVIGVCATLHIQNHLFYAEPLGLLTPETMPLRHDVGAIGRGGGRELHVARGSAFEQPTFDTGHDLEILSRANERHGPGR